MRAQEDPNYVKVLAKGLRLIEAMAESKTSFQLSDLARALGQPKTSVFRILFTLKQEGYVRQHPVTETYELTERIALFRRNKLDEILKRTARPFLGRLLGRFEQTVNLAVLDSGQVRYTEILEGLRSIRSNPTVNTTAAIHATALGKSILAFLKPSEAKALIEANAPLPMYTSQTITSIRLLMSELSTIRKQGYSVDNEETEEGARCVGAPLLNAQGESFAAISICGPVSSFRDFTVREITGALKQATKGIAAQMGNLA